MILAQLWVWALSLIDTYRTTVRDVLSIQLQHGLVSVFWIVEIYKTVSCRQPTQKCKVNGFNHKMKTLFSMLFLSIYLHFHNNIIELYYIFEFDKFITSTEVHFYLVNISCTAAGFYQTLSIQYFLLLYSVVYSQYITLYWRKIL